MSLIILHAPQRRNLHGFIAHSLRGKRMVGQLAMIIAD